MRIIDTGRHRKKATPTDLFELWDKRNKLVKKPIKHMSRKHGDVIYGRQAVNQLLGRGYHRETYDYDVYSHSPRNHALRIEQSIDRGTDSNLAYIKPKNIGGRIVYRVKVRPYGNNEVDYTGMPSDIKYVKKNGVRYETLGRAHKKYSGMIKRGETHRMPRAYYDKNDIESYKTIKKVKKKKWWRL